MQLFYFLQTFDVGFVTYNSLWLTLLVIIYYHTVACLLLFTSEVANAYEGGNDEGFTAP